ncbi:hypothetical protein EYF80_022809 [Liparis tanakae]|uniref:Uncharacterized protein n=1 Tax=Liparis tanakae TaxID=230148 RepID=A0A4Z2HMG0_9TELE|nr:hypothetical protein EYF80_022809 [Liparis tanakae]
MVSGSALRVKPCRPAAPAAILAATPRCMLEDLPASCCQSQGKMGFVGFVKPTDKTPLETAGLQEGPFFFFKEVCIILERVAIPGEKEMVELKPGFLKIQLTFTNDHAAAPGRGPRVTAARKKTATGADPSAGRGRVALKFSAWRR